jgi:hypothetical protein
MVAIKVPCECAKHFCFYRNRPDFTLRPFPRCTHFCITLFYNLPLNYVNLFPLEITTREITPVTLALISKIA